MKKVDMSSDAITERLKIVDELRRRCLLLMKTKNISFDEARKIVDAEYFESLKRKK
jgi:hypothetical protein